MVGAFAEHDARASLPSAAAVDAFPHHGGAPRRGDCMLKPLSRLSLAFVVAFTALLGTNALAQQAQPAQPDRYVVVSYIKVLPGQEAAYRSYLTTTAKKVHQELMADNANLLTWSSAQTMFQGMEHGSDFDFVGAAVYAGTPPEPGANVDAIMMKAAGMSQADLGKKLATMRTIVGTEVLRYRAGTMAPGVLKEGDVRVVGRVKVKPGMGDEYLEMAKSMAEPMMQARVTGGELKSWSLWSRVFPSGAATSYDALTVTYFKDMASAIKGLDAAKGVEAFQKTHPGKSYGAYINNARDYSELQHRFVMQVIALVERAR
jgi:hypothetical protein